MGGGRKVGGREGQRKRELGRIRRMMGWLEGGHLEV